jgi:hypothetical protein
MEIAPLEADHSIAPPAPRRPRSIPDPFDASRKPSSPDN